MIPNICLVKAVKYKVLSLTSASRFSLIRTLSYSDSLLFRLSLIRTLSAQNQ